MNKTFNETKNVAEIIEYKFNEMDEKRKNFELILSMDKVRNKFVTITLNDLIVNFLFFNLF